MLRGGSVSRVLQSSYRNIFHGEENVIGGCGFGEQRRTAAVHARSRRTSRCTVRNVAEKRKKVRLKVSAAVPRRIHLPRLHAPVCTRKRVCVITSTGRPVCPRRDAHIGPLCTRVRTITRDLSSRKRLMSFSFAMRKRIKLPQP